MIEVFSQELVETLSPHHGLYRLEKSSALLVRNVAGTRIGIATCEIDVQSSIW